MEDRTSVEVEDLMKMLRLTKELGHKAREGDAYCNLSEAYFKLGNFEKAVEYSIQGLSIVKQLGDRSREGKLYGALGHAFYKMGNFKQAIVNHKKDLGIAKEIGDKAQEGNACGDLGAVYDSQGNFKQGIEYHMKDLSIAKELGDRVGERRAYENLAGDYHRLRDFKQAIEYYMKHLTVVKELGERAKEENAYGCLAEAFLSLGNFKQAEENLKKHDTIAKELGHKPGEGRLRDAILGNFKQAKEIYTEFLGIAKESGNKFMEEAACGNLGIACYKEGDFKQAVEYHKQRLRIAREVGNRTGEGCAFGGLGNAYESLGYYKQAIEYHEQCLSIAKEMGDRAWEGGVYGNLGNVYKSLGEFQKSIECHTKHLRISEQLWHKDGEKNALQGLGNVYYQLKDFQQAIKYYEQGLIIAIELGNKAVEGTAYGNLGNAYEGLDNLELAVEYHMKCLSISKEVGDKAAEGRTYCNLGNAYCNLGKFEKAIEYHSHDLRIAKEVGAIPGEGIACYSLGLDYERLSCFSQAKDYYRSSVKLFNDTRALLKSEDAWKISFRDHYQDAYTALWRSLLKNGEINEALGAAEQGRAQALMDILKEQYGIGELPSMSVEPKEIIPYVLHKLSPQTVFVALDKHIISIWLLRKGKEIHFKQKAIKHGSATLLMEATLKEIGAGVGVRCENRSLDDTSDDPPAHRGAIDEKARSSTCSVNSLRPLYDVIIAPIADLLQGDQLIVIPDGPFCLAPYSALSESIKILTVPSLTALNLITSSPEDMHSKTGALLVGDPSVDELPLSLSQLPYARKEVEMIGKLLKTAPLTGRSATKSEVLKRISSVALVHIAAHGRQETGEIALAPNPERASQVPQEEDYILTMSDVQAVHLKARLVVLSCCHSGRGEVKSEGVVGIARAFLCAGARSVLVSLWAIDDEATLQFMESFYQQLADGKRTSSSAP